MRERDPRNLPIGIFDSGMGGLTVLRALMRRLPDERFCYLGDTARLPYGTKSSDTIVRYSLQVARTLVEQGIKLLVVACNTATAAALERIREAYPALPVLGVIEPGARAACGASASGNIVVLGTESTIRGEAYTRAIRALRPEAVVTGIACTLFVPLAEEGWTDGPVAQAAAARYLAPLQGNPPDCLVLGCTHFPPLAPVIRSVLGEGVALVDSADTTAEAVEAHLREKKLLRPAPAGETSARFLTTDSPERFARVGGLFLGRELARENLELVVL